MNAANVPMVCSPRPPSLHGADQVLPSMTAGTSRTPPPAPGGLRASGVALAPHRTSLLACSGPGDTRASPGRTGRGERRYGRRGTDAEESQSPFVRLMMDELSEADRATAWAEIKAVSYTHLRAHETPEHLVC